VIDNAELGYGWSTYPELLQNAGISWKVYQDVGDGLDARDFWGYTDDAYIGNYGDNSLLYFFQYQNALAAARLQMGQKREPIFCKVERYSTCSAKTFSRISCRKCRGLSRPKRTPSAPIGPRTTAHGTSRRCSMR
jgi:hypothetical protein